MNPGGIAGICLAIIGFGLLKRISQAVLWVLNHGHRS